MRYIAYEESKSTPNIVVDGSANAGTELVLSHWPNNGTPRPLKADLSAQIVFNYLDQPDLHVNVDAATNNHFDADGLVGLFALLNPDDAEDLREVLIEIAEAGDFGTFKNRDAARVNFVLDAWTNPRLSPLKASVLAQSHAEVSNVLYEELLPRLPKIIEKIDFQEKFWGAQDELLEESDDAFEEKKFRLKEYPQVDLAIVSMPDCNRTVSQSVHRMAVHNRTDCMRILLMQENKFELYFRYETWVDYQSRALAPRVDMRDFAMQLSKQESMDGNWVFNDINDFTPTLQLIGDAQSKISCDSFRQQTIEYLTNCARSDQG